MKKSSRMNCQTPRNSQLVIGNIHFGTLLSEANSQVFKPTQFFPIPFGSHRNKATNRSCRRMVTTSLRLLRSYGQKKRTAALREIIAAMSLVVPDLENITVQALGGFIVPRFLIRPVNGNAHYFDVDQMSDGTLRILGILVALYQEPGPDVIALEEPELTVHPGLLQMLAEAIKDVGRTKQILVTTHSPEFLDNFDPADVIAVDGSNGITKASGISETQISAVRQDLFRLGELMTIEGLHA